jgi:TusE/DsrC/DsvC family sulfur relay protein
MGYTVNGTELETDAEGYLLEADYSDEVVQVIAAAEGITLTDDHWKVVNYLRDEYRENGHTPNFRAMLKGLEDVLPGCDSKSAVRPVPGRPGQAGRQGRRAAAAPGQRRY